jgi:hypothetical protein
VAPGEIDAVRSLLGSKPRPVGWQERRGQHALANAGEFIRRHRRHSGQKA